MKRIYFWLETDTCPSTAREVRKTSISVHPISKDSCGILSHNPNRIAIVGDCFSAADLPFASSSAPGAVPTEYGGRFLKLNQLPDEMVEQIQILRETVAGKYALRLYQGDRYVQGV